MANYIHVPPGSPEVPKLDIVVREQEDPSGGGGGGGGYRQGALQLLSRLRPEWKAEEVTLKPLFLNTGAESGGPFPMKTCYWDCLL